MRKWRALLEVSQVDVAEKLNCSPSVISDYETGRRRSPGSSFIRRFVEALLDIDGRKGGRYMRQLSRIAFDPSDVFIDIREFSTPVTVKDICEAVDGEVLVGENALQHDVFGYTVIDSLRAIHSLSGLDFYRIFGATSERALVFCRCKQRQITNDSREDQSFQAQDRRPPRPKKEDRPTRH